MAPLNERARKLALSVALAVLSLAPDASTAAGSCALTPVAFPARNDAPALIGENELRVFADELSYADGAYNFSGRVLLLRGDYKLASEKMTFAPDTERAAAIGDTHIKTPALYLRTRDVTVDLKESSVRIDEMRFDIHEDSFHGSTRRADASLDEQKLKLGRTWLSRCPGQSPTWLFRASRVKVDVEADRMKIYNPVLRLGKVPVFYFPYLAFPASIGPASGFLTPAVRISRRAGFLFNLPFYWRINDQHDMTFSPRWWTISGFQYNHEYRFLTRYVSGEVNLSTLDSAARADTREAYWGHSINVRAGAHDHYARLYLQGVSDREYLLRYDTGLALGSFLFRARLAYRYAGENLQVYFNYARWRESFYPDPGVQVIRFDGGDQEPRLDIDYDVPGLPRGLYLRLSTTLRRDVLNTRPGDEEAPVDASFLAQTYRGRALLEYTHPLAGGDLSLGGVADYVHYHKTGLPAARRGDFLHQFYWDWRWDWTRLSGAALHRFSVRWKQLYNPGREREVSEVFGSHLENWIPTTIFSLNPYVGEDHVPKQQVSALMFGGSHHFSPAESGLHWRWRLGTRFNNAAGATPRPFQSDPVDASGRQGPRPPVNFDDPPDARLLIYHAQFLESARLGRLEVEHAWVPEPGYHEWFTRWHKSDGSSLYDLAWRRRADVVDHALAFSRVHLTGFWYLNLGFRYDFVSRRNSRAYIGTTYASCCMAFYLNVGKDLYDSFSFGFRIDLFGGGESPKAFDWSLPGYLRERRGTNRSLP